MLKIIKSLTDHQWNEAVDLIESNIDATMGMIERLDMPMDEFMASLEKVVEKKTANE